MKKGILFFSLFLLGTFIVFGFQNPVNTVKSISEKSIKITDNIDIAPIAVFNGKCGEGKCGEGKAATAKEATAVKKECASKGEPSAHKCGEKMSLGGEPHKCSMMDNDKDADGKVSFDEFTAHYASEFPKCDKNSDGKVTSDECMMFEKFNADGDDVLSADEFKKSHEAMFAELDKNADGFIDADEHKMCCAAKDGAAKCAGSANATGSADKKASCTKAEKAACTKAEKAKCDKSVKAETPKKCGAGKCCGGGKTDNSEKK